MKGRIELILGGVGGQGILTIGTILGEAALQEGLFACLSSSYGTEARGTFTRSDLILSEDSIDFIEVTAPNVVLCLAQTACDRLLPVLSPGGEILFDSDQVTAADFSGISSKGYPVTSMALERGYPRGANLIALGLLVKRTGAVTPESVLSVLSRKIASRSSGNKEPLEAFTAGYSAVL